MLYLNIKLHLLKDHFRHFFLQLFYQHVPLTSTVNLVDDLSKEGCRLKVDFFDRLLELRVIFLFAQIFEEFEALFGVMDVVFRRFLYLCDFGLD